MHKKEYKIFFAISFDNATKGMYEWIVENLDKKYNNKEEFSLKYVIGKEQIGGEYPKYSDIESFKALNIPLQNQIFQQIAEANIFIADLTTNNPNVLFELGIALQLNKNILRVSGTNAKNIPFDIHSLEAYFYKDENHLLDEITQYVDKFIEIKNLDYNKQYGKLYKIISKEEIIESAKDSNVSIPYLIEGYHFRDGGVRLKFKFLKDDNTNEGWFGVALRTQWKASFSGYLLHIRQKGKVALALNGNPFPKEENLNRVIEFDEIVLLSINIDNHLLNGEVNNIPFNFKGLYMQEEGGIIISCWKCKVQFYDIELINRDTITPFYWELYL